MNIIGIAWKCTGMGCTGRLGNERLYPGLFSSRFYALTSLRETITQIGKEFFQNKSGLVLVDFGCGTMPYRPLFEKYVAQYIGVDLAGNPHADLYAEMLGKTPLPDECADVVLSTQVLEHVLNPAEYLHECYRILKPEGLLILSTHGYWMYHPDPHDLWRWTSEGLKKIVADAGFQITGFYGLMGLASASLQLLQDALMPKFPRILRPIFAFLMQRLVLVADVLTSPQKKTQDAAIYVVVAKKRGNP